MAAIKAVSDSVTRHSCCQCMTVGDVGGMVFTSQSLFTYCCTVNVIIGYDVHCTVTNCMIERIQGRPEDYAACK